MPKKHINTLDFYGYGENNKMESVQNKGYKVKVSDKDGNIITIEKDDSLYACVKLAFDNDTGVLSLLDAAHNDSLLAEIEMPNADYIYNCRFDEELNAILFDVKSLYGNETSTIELDVESLIELYEDGQGIEIGEKNELTGRRPISIKLAEGENILQVSESGLSISDAITTDDELAAAISGKADIEWVEEVLSGFSGITEVIEILEEHEDEIEKLQRIVGTDEEIPSLFEQIEDNREDIAQIDEEMGELSGSVVIIGEKVDSIEGNISGLTEDVQELKDTLKEEAERATSAETELYGEIDAEAGRAISAEAELSNKINEEIEARKAYSVASADYDSTEKTINFRNTNNEVIDSIDASEFIKDGMIDSVELIEISGDTYIHIVFNTDAGKEDIYINIGNVFDADNYYTKSDVDEKINELTNVDSLQWEAINQNRQDMENAYSQLFNAIDDETTNRRNADSDLLNSITDETQARINGDNAVSAAIDSKVAEEKARAQQAEVNITSNLNDEIQRATREEARIETKYDNDIEGLRQADRELRQYINDQDTTINNRIDGVVSDLESEENARITTYQNLSNEIQDIRLNYAAKTYVDSCDEQIKDEAISTSISSAKTYTDNEVDILENTLKQYCDNEHQELLEGISENTTKINKISNLNTNPDGSYSDTGNGILDVLHREFHYHIEHDGAIKEIKYENGNLIIIYDTQFGEKETIIPVSSIIDLSNYYTKNEVDDKIDNFESDLCDLINDEVQRATDAEHSINDRINNLVLECGIYENNLYN